jgi:hypothetical protein
MAGLLKPSADRRDEANGMAGEECAKPYVILWKA